MLLAIMNSFFVIYVLTPLSNWGYVRIKGGQGRLLRALLLLLVFIQFLLIVITLFAITATVLGFDLIINRKENQ